MKKLLPIIIVIVAVVAAFVVYYFFLRPQPEAVEPTRYEQLEDSTPWVPGEYFVTNITGSSALAKTSVSLLLLDDESTFLDQNVAVVRNAIIRVLIAHPEEEMRASTALTMLENEMTEAVREATGLNEDVIEQVVISDFVIQ